jgi:hypothetical protein
MRFCRIFPDAEAAFHGHSSKYCGRCRSRWIPVSGRLPGASWQEKMVFVRRPSFRARRYFQSAWSLSEVGARELRSQKGRTGPPGADSYAQGCPASLVTPTAFSSDPTRRLVGLAADLALARRVATRDPAIWHHPLFPTSRLKSYYSELLRFLNLQIILHSAHAIHFLRELLRSRFLLRRRHDAVQ